MSRAAWLAAAMLVMASAAHADERADLAARQADTAQERNSDPGVDPWMAGASLVTRPSFLEAFKLANTTDDEGGSTYSLSIGGAVLAPAAQVAEGLQLTAAYAPATKLATAGVKWSYSFGDVRRMTDAQVQAITAVAATAYDGCELAVVAALPPRPAAAAAAEAWDATLAEKLTPCQEAEATAQDQGIDDFRRWKPALSVSLSAGRDFENDVNGTAMLNIAAELKGAVGGITAAVAVNAEAEDAPPAMATTTARERHAGGGVAITASIWKASLQLEAKLLACLSRTCVDGDSTTSAGGTVAIQIKDDVAFGVTVTATGDGADLSDAIAALELSYSFDDPGKK